MRQKNRFSTKTILCTVGLGSFLLLSSCAMLVQPTAEMLAPLDMAMGADLAALRSQAERGDPQAQLAMSLVTTYGLHGEPPALPLGTDWLSRALASRRVIPITQYTPAFNGQPSRVNIIHVPVSNIPPGQVAAINRCVVALTQHAASADCGDTIESQTARQLAWVRARR